MTADKESKCVPVTMEKNVYTRDDANKAFLALMQAQHEALNGKPAPHFPSFIGDSRKGGASCSCATKGASHLPRFPRSIYV